MHAIEGSGHNDAFAMVCLPEDLLMEADAWTPTPPGAKPPALVNPLWLNLSTTSSDWDSMCSVSRRCTARRRARPTSARRSARPPLAAALQGA